MALGAKIIEKHITISKKDKFSDAFFLEFKNLNLMVRNIRELEKSLGEEKKIISK
jgi:sialic acid synthase SpsE